MQTETLRLQASDIVVGDEVANRKAGPYQRVEAITVHPLAVRLMGAEVAAENRRRNRRQTRQTLYRPRHETKFWVRRQVAAAAKPAKPAARKRSKAKAAKPRKRNTSAVVQDRRAQENGARVLVIDVRKDKGHNWTEDEGGRWVTWCDRHETFAQHETKRGAKRQAASPTTWCGLCAEDLD